MKQLTTAPSATPVPTGKLTIEIFEHPQGCRGYVIADSTSKDALALDIHADLVSRCIEVIQRAGWKLRFVVDSHTHADHPSGAAALAAALQAKRVAHPASQHKGVDLHPEDGTLLHLGQAEIVVRYAPGHTPDHMVLVTDQALFSGDSLFIGGVARTDFLGGDAATLFDSIQRVIKDLQGDTVLYPGHDYAGRRSSTIGAEKATNPWLALSREEFARQLAANPPPEPANMKTLLAMNRSGIDLPERMSATELKERINDGGAASVLDVRSGVEFESEHIQGSRSIPLDELARRIDEVRAMPAPRLLVCANGPRAERAATLLKEHDVVAIRVVEGGLRAYLAAGGTSQKGIAVMSLERQVRIGAGSLVLVGVGLGFFVHPLGLILSAFVGSGLIFAGVTDWCGMGLLLAKAPWNRSKGATASTAGGGTCASTPPAACAASAPSKTNAGSQK